MEGEERLEDWSRLTPNPLTPSFRLSVLDVSVVILLKMASWHRGEQESNWPLTGCHASSAPRLRMPCPAGRTPLRKFDAGTTNGLGRWVRLDEPLASDPWRKEGSDVLKRTLGPGDIA